MKFLIRKTSDRIQSDTPPCNGCEKLRYDMIDIRTCKSFEEFDKNHKGYRWPWTAHGVDHCINEKGLIQRRFPNQCEGWFKEINTLEELMALYAACGKSLVLQEGICSDIPLLEIYDDYRE